MPLYENIFIARQDISAAQAEALADTFTQILKDQGGSVTKREYWGLRNLTFRIKKNRKAHYMLLNIDAPPAAVLEMERNMRINEDILRHLTVRVEELEEGPSAMMQRREERGDRGDRGYGDRGFGDRGFGGDRGDRGGFRRRDSEGGDDRGGRDAAPMGETRTDGGAA